MKKIILVSAAFLTFAAMQSCSKCGHCHKETTSTYKNWTGNDTTVVTKSDDAIVCGNSNNESGSYAKQTELNCKAWAANQVAHTGVTYSSSWVADK